MLCLNWVDGSDDGEKFVRELLSYVDDEINGDSHKSIISST